MDNQGYLKCPNCGRYTMRSSKTVGLITLFVALGTVFFFMFIPPLLILSLLIFFLGVAALLAKTTYRCTNCYYKIIDEHDLKI